MKRIRIFALLLALCLLAFCASCAKNGGDHDTTTEAHATTESTTQMSTTEAETEPEIDAAYVMDSFVRRLQEGNYLIDVEDNLDTVVYSPEQVYFTYSEDSGLESYAYMTVKGETFAGTLDETSMYDITFVSTENAIDAAASVLPNSWITLSGGNMWDLFYNNVDNILEFTSNDENVKRTLLSLGGYGPFALSRCEEVHMVMDAPDPTSVHFTAVIPDNEAARIYYDDLDLTLQFDAAKSDPRIEKWISSPTYPPTRNAWTSDDIAMLDNVFMRDYGTTAVPFPAFASYALNFDPDAYDQRTEVRIIDAHGTEKDLEDYKAMLLSKGFQEVPVELEDGSSVNVYRLLLREDYRSYAELYPYFDNGFVLDGGLYHDDPVYEGQDAISEVLVENGFEALPEADIFTGWTAADHSAAQTEGWAYFFNYDLYMPMVLTYEDANAAKAYWKDYGNKLAKKGFISGFAPGEDDLRYESPNGFVIFRTTWGEDNTVLLEFKNEKSLTAEQVNAL
ncbi:MAG: hypothetical protein IJM26_03335, partial [Lachnospiraceae bacterium]|nr:hypothetical protein [Lachnospiraceae bacterium]